MITRIGLERDIPEYVLSMFYELHNDLNLKFPTKIVSPGGGHVYMEMWHTHFVGIHTGTSTIKFKTITKNQLRDDIADIIVYVTITRKNTMLIDTNNQPVDNLSDYVGCIVALYAF